MSVPKFLAFGLVLTCAAGCERPDAAAVRPEPDPAEASPPPVAPQASPVLSGVDLGEPVRALGTEPFWALDLTSERGLVLTGADRPEIAAPASSFAANGNQASVSGEAPDGRTLTLVLTPGPCSDGMSDRIYPLTATVSFGGETLKGCAASAEALARTGESGEVR